MLWTVRTKIHLLTDRRLFPTDFVGQFFVASCWTSCRMQLGGSCMITYIRRSIVTYTRLIIRATTKENIKFEAALVHSETNCIITEGCYWRCSVVRSSLPENIITNTNQLLVLGRRIFWFTVTQATRSMFYNLLGLLQNLPLGLTANRPNPSSSR